jgi:hypothetical protein
MFLEDQTELEPDNKLDFKAELPSVTEGVYSRNQPTTET